MFSMGMNKIFIIAMCLLFSCTSPPKEVAEVATDTLVSPSEGIRNYEIRGAEIDSARVRLILDQALVRARQYIDSVEYKSRYETRIDDSSFVAEVDIEIGKLFSNQRHALIRRRTPWATYINLYEINQRKFDSLFYKEQGGMTYIRDSVADVNGDGFRDFMVHWYPLSGCCRRDIYSVYLNKSTKGFSSEYQFINPTFSPSEKIIRGVAYGHPGQVPLYKYRWNGNRVDTIEFIYPHATRKGYYIKTARPRYSSKSNAEVIIKFIPSEYLAITSFDWFILEQ